MDNITTALDNLRATIESGLHEKEIAIQDLKSEVETLTKRVDVLEEQIKQQQVLIQEQSTNITKLIDNTILTQNSKIDTILKNSTEHKIMYEAILTAINGQDPMKEATEKIVNVKKQKEKFLSIKDFYIREWVNDTKYPSKTDPNKYVYFRSYFISNECIKAINSSSFDKSDLGNANIANLVWNIFQGYSAFANVTASDPNYTDGIKYKKLVEKYKEYETEYEKVNQ